MKKQLLSFIVALSFCTAIWAQSTDVILKHLDLPTYAPVGELLIKGTLQNASTVNLDYVYLNYRINGQGEIYSTALNDLNLEPAGSMDFEHSQPWATNNQGEYTLDVWLTTPNGTIDGNNADNSLSKMVYRVANPPEKFLMMEKISALWCGWCPDGDLLLDTLHQEYPNLLEVAVSHQDTLAYAASDSLGENYANGYPSAMFDRIKFEEEWNVGMARERWRERINDAMADVAPIAVTLDNTFDPLTRQLTINMTSDFMVDMTGDYRMNCYVVVKELVDPMYEQTNFFDVLEGHPYYGQGNPIVDYVHKNVSIALLGGPWGQAGVIPNEIQYLDSFSTNFNFTVPEGLEMENLHIVGFVQKYDQNKFERRLLNAAKQDVKLAGSTTSIADQQNKWALDLYPNPSQDFVHLDLSLVADMDIKIELLNPNGQVIDMIHDGWLAQGEQSMSLDLRSKNLAAGIYMIRLSNDEGVEYLRMVKQ